MFHNLHAVDVHMYESLPIYGCSCWQRFWWSHRKTSGFLPRGKPLRSVVVEAEDPHHSCVLPHQFWTYLRSITTFTWCGCTNVWVLTMISLLSSAVTPRLLLFSPKGQTTSCAIVEAVDPFKWAPTSTLNTYKVYHNPNIICCGCA